MNKALKIAELDKSGKQSEAETTAETIKNLNTEDIRAKIKAARLEKLMARQLESELSIELEPEIELVTVEDIQEPEPVIEKSAVTMPGQVEIEIPVPRSRGYSAGSSKRMRNIQATRHSCDEMVTRIRNGADIMAGLNEQTANLVKQLQFMEQEFARFEEAEAKATKLGEEHKRVTGEYEEALNLIEKQNRQLSVLEAQRASSNSNYEHIKAEFEKLQRQQQRDADLLAESQMVNSELEQDNRSLKSKLASTEHNYSELTIELQSTANTLKQKDMEAAKAVAELASARERLNNAEAGLESTSLELEALSKQMTDKEIEYQNLETKHSGMAEKIGTMEESLERSTKEVETLTAELHEKEMTCAKLTSDYSSLIKSNSKVMTDFDNIQKKYDELNKHALEQQSQQYARIHELESILRDTKRRLELKNKENAEISVELEATNNLLVLHEEMVAALSPEDRR